jgi:hypothetical protein
MFKIIKFTFINENDLFGWPYGPMFAKCKLKLCGLCCICNNMCRGDVAL